jgi:hypothetical protein
LIFDRFIKILYFLNSTHPFNSPLERGLIRKIKARYNNLFLNLHYALNSPLERGGAR